MKKLSKAILIALAVLFVLAVVIFFGTNLYLQSPGTQAKIQEEISRALRLPLTITNTSLTPWSDLRITGITIPDGETALLQATSFNAHYRLLPLLHGKLVIYAMSVENPRIVWSQNAEGKWELPKPEKAAATSAEDAKKKTAAAATPAETEATPAPSGTPATEVKTAEEKPKKKARKGPDVTVEGFEIKHGSVDLLDQQKELIATFSDVNMTYTTLTAERMAGTAVIGRASWMNTVTLENVQTPFTFADGELNLSALTATLGTGSVTGTLKLNSKAKDSPFTSTLTLNQVDVAKVSTEAGWPDGQMGGLLDGTLELHGNSKQIARAEGRAEMKLRDGHFRGLSYLDIVGPLLQIDELSDLKLQDGRAEVRIADEKAFIESVTLEASDLQLTAKGVARFDSKLMVTARLFTQDKLFTQLPSLVRENFAVGENGQHYIDFDITGKVNKPKTNLLDKIFNQKKMETQLDDLLSGLFGTKKKADAPKPDKKAEDPKKADKKKKKDDPAVAPPTPAATSTPAATPAAAAPLASPAPAAPALVAPPTPTPAGSPSSTPLPPEQ